LRPVRGNVLVRTRGREAASMNILVVAGDVPATSGMPGSPRLFSFCRELSRQHRIFLLARGGSEERWGWFLGEPEVTKVFAEVTRLPDAPPAG